jgi:hypothetical protein
LFSTAVNNIIKAQIKRDGDVTIGQMTIGQNVVFYLPCYLNFLETWPAVASQLVEQLTSDPNFEGLNPFAASTG